MTQAAARPYGHDDYRALADAIPQIVWSAHADGAVVYFNRSWYRYTGQSEDEALADGWSAAIHPDDAAGAVARWRDSVANGEPHESEFRLRRSDGTYRWFVGRGEAIRDASGTVARWYGGCTDIDDLKRAETSLRENASTFRKLANSLPQIVWITNAAGTNTFLNHRWHDYTGIRPGSPHDLRQAMHPDDADRVMEMWRDARGGGHVFEAEFRIRRVDDVYRWFLTRAVPVRASDDTIVEWFGSCTDIEDKKRAEADVLAAYERERRIASTLQTAFLTHSMPNVDGFAFDAVYRASEREAEVGGDWYDAIELDDGRIVISIGDVAGHGLDAAVVMGNVRQSIRVVAQVADLDPVAMLDAVDRSLRRDAPGIMVTAFIGIIDPASDALTFASAGHPPPLMFADGTIAELKAPGLPLGLREGGGGTPARATLPGTGTIVLYTDGLIEATHDLAEGERRLREALLRVVRDGCENPAEEIQASVLREGARDDVAVMTLTLTERQRP